jgi:sigma-B regulation protein RsbU (phosphoserine phosphatase)
MENEPKTCCAAVSAGTVDVLFVGDRLISDDLADKLDHHNFAWEMIPVCQVQTYLNRHAVGVLVLDGESIHPAYLVSIQSALAKLDSKNVPVICYNCPSSVDLTSLRLAVTTSTVEFDDLWARIETAVLFARRFREPNAGGPSDTVPNSDTAEQLEMAARVQRNFLPARLPNTEGIRWATVFRPAEWVSGDIYDVARLDEEHIGFYLADAVGHSVPAALLTMFLKQAIVMRQTIGDRYVIFRPADVVKTLNHRMVEQELNGCLFATCFYGLLNIRTLQLDYARAGHPYPVLIRDDQLISLQTRGGLLGVFESSEFEQHSLQLQRGDKLFVYSDGGEPLIGENNEDGSLKFFDTFKHLCRLPVDQMLRQYSQMAAEYKFGPDQIDDVTAVALEIA